jgi:Trk K+ transport system NAD-binding subunit
LSDIQFVGAPKRTPFRRILRAAMRDTSALWSEFRRPILMFVLATLGGGWLYGELLVFAGYPRVPFIDLPYMMVLLMVLESFADIPPEPYLVIFWYGMPLIALYVIGQGVTDFVRLFFNRGERRSAWEEAVASTYRNHIIVMGIGHVGLRVVRALEAMGSEVVAIDLDEPGNPLPDMTGLRSPLIVGDGRSSVTLEKAGLRHAGALIVCTANDFLNLEVCVRAREMNPDMRIVVRMWDTQLSNHLKRSLNAETISASDLSAPAFAGSAVGVDIAPMLRIRDASYSLIRLQVASGSFMDGRTINVLQDENDMDIVLFERNEQVEVHPSGEQPVRAGDTLVIFARHAQVMQIVARNRGHS